MCWTRKVVGGKRGDEEEDDKGEVGHVTERSKNPTLRLLGITQVHMWYDISIQHCSGTKNPRCLREPVAATYKTASKLITSLGEKNCYPHRSFKAKANIEDAT